MAITFSTWRPLVPTEIERTPDSPGVFELATLVRTVVRVGVARESLSTTLAEHLATPLAPHLPTGRLYFRTHATERPDEVQRDVLEEYCRAHGGALPPAQTAPAEAASHPGRHLKAV